MASSKKSSTRSSKTATAAKRSHNKKERTPAEITARAERQMLSWVQNNYSLVLSGLSCQQERFANARSYANWQNVISASNSFGSLLGDLGYGEFGHLQQQNISQPANISSNAPEPLAMTTSAGS